MTRPGLRALLWIGGVLVAVNVLLLVLDAVTRQPGGPTSSSYATGPDGLAAYADLVARAGHPVDRIRTPPDEEAPDPDSTFVVLDPDALLPDQTLALRRFAERGGRLVIGGAFPVAWSGTLLRDPPDWRPVGPRDARTLVPVAETAGVERVRTAGAGGWTEAKAALPVVGRRGDPALVLVSELGAGRVALLADASPLQNRGLAHADNAALGLALAGPPERPVAFLETVHGYGEGRGLAALPASWRWALAGLALAGLVWLLARAWRLGPPEREARDLPPPRRAYVDALGATLARTRRPGEAVAPVRAAARRRLERRAGLRPGARPEELRRAAERLGLTEEEAGAVTGENDEVMAAGRALARLGGPGR